MSWSELRERRPRRTRRCSRPLRAEIVGILGRGIMRLRRLNGRALGAQLRYQYYNLLSRRGYMQDWFASWKQRLILLMAVVILFVVIFGMPPIIRSWRREYYQRLAHQSLQQLSLPPGAWTLPKGGSIFHSDGCGPQYSVTEISVYSSNLSVDQIMSFYDQHLNDTSSWNVTSRGGNGLSAELKSDSRVTLGIFVPHWTLTGDELNNNTNRQPDEIALIQALSRGEEPFSIILSQGYDPLVFAACPKDDD